MDKQDLNQTRRAEKTPYHLRQFAVLLSDEVRALPALLLLLLLLLLPTCGHM